MSKKSSNMFSFTLGAMTGILIGMLYAPDIGSHTRGKLSFKADKYRNLLFDLLQDLSRGKVRLVNQAKKAGDQIIFEAKEKAEDLLGDVDALIDKMK